MNVTADFWFKKLILKLCVLLERELLLIELYTPILSFQIILSMAL